MTSLFGWYKVLTPVLSFSRLPSDHCFLPHRTLICGERVICVVHKQTRFGAQELSSPSADSLNGSAGTGRAKAPRRCEEAASCSHGAPRRRHCLKQNTHRQAAELGLAGRPPRREPSFCTAEGWQGGGCACWPCPGSSCTHVMCTHDAPRVTSARCAHMTQRSHSGASALETGRPYWLEWQGAVARSPTVPLPPLHLPQALRFSRQTLVPLALAFI